MESNIVKNTLAQLSTHILKELLKNHCNGNESLPVETVLAICEILAGRGPSPEGAAVAAWNRFQALYIATGR